MLKQIFVFDSKFILLNEPPLLFPVEEVLVRAVG